MKRTRVRFNLGKGKNYMKWKVEYPDKKVEYFHRIFLIKNVTFSSPQLY